MPPGYPTDIPPVPPGKTVVAREQIYKFGFPEHLAKTTQVIKAMRDRDQVSFAEARDWLKANRQSVDFDQATALDRRKFNEAAEQKIVLARANKDTASLRESAIALDTFLQQNFGAATAHLNLAIVRVLLDEPQAALPAAFHTIVFNPEGANGWVLLGAALSGNKDIAGGAGAFCAALNIAKYSPKTIGLFTRIEAGDEYMSGGAKEAVQRTHAMCPGAGW